MSTDKKANASGRTAPKAHDLGKIRVGRLPTMNQDEYPGLSGWWVQLRIGEDGEEVLARVYGNTPEQAHSRATALAGQPGQALTQQTLDDVMAGIPARDAEIEALRKELETLQAEVLSMVQMLETNEWAEHCGESELGQRLGWAITALQNRQQNIPEIIPGTAQQDADKVDSWQCTTTLTDSDDLVWLYCQDTNTIGGPVASSPEFIDSWTHWAWVEHPSTASINAARKEPGQ